MGDGDYQAYVQAENAARRKPVGVSQWRKKYSPRGIANQQARTLKAVILVTPSIPPELCGIGGCSLTPHGDEVPHTWA